MPAQPAMTHRLRWLAKDSNRTSLVTGLVSVVSVVTVLLIQPWVVAQLPPANSTQETISNYLRIVFFPLFLAAWSPQYKDNVWMVLLALAAVLGSWVTVVYYHALHYLRLWAAKEPVEMQLGDNERPRFSDFLFFSIDVATLHGSNMVWLSRRGRRAVAEQSVLALGFNTVVLAITVALVAG